MLQARSLLRCQCLASQRLQALPVAAQLLWNSLVIPALLTQTAECQGCVLFVHVLAVAVLACQLADATQKRAPRLLQGR